MSEPVYKKDEVWKNLLTTSVPEKHTWRTNVRVAQVSIFYQNKSHVKLNVIN